MGRNFFYILIFQFLFSSNLYSQEDKLNKIQLKGYLKDLQNVYFEGTPDSLTTSNLIHNRINFRWTISEKFYTRIELRNRIFYGEQVEQTHDFGKLIDRDYGYEKLSILWVDEKSLVIQSAIDRILLNYSADKLSITAGRQRINWGINTIWNPNDLFNAYNFLDFDYEERPGTDGIRIQYYPNTSSAAEIAYKPSKEKNQTVAAGLFKTNKWKYDFQFLGGIYFRDIVFGTGWAGNLKDAGFKGEASYFRSKENFSTDNGSISASASIDYSFKNNLYVSGAMLYQSDPPILIPDKYFFSSPELSAKYLMPYNYSLYGSIMKGFSPIVNGIFAVIYSPTDNSTIFFPTFTWSVAENFDLDLTLQSFFSEQSNKYETQGNNFYIRIKWSF